MRNKQKVLKIILAVLCVGLIFILGGYFVVDNYYSKMNYKTQDEVVLPANDNVSEEIEQDTQTTEDSPEELIKRMEDAIKKNLENESTQLVSSDEVFNILLIGSDNRAGVAGSRSDSNIVASINKSTKEITLTSFMRDSYVSIPGYSNNRLNASYAYGGPSLLIDTIETNFKIPIERYVQVDFFAFIDIIDAIGGVDIEISDAEMDLINKYSGEINRIQGLDSNADALTESGLVHLNGKQALSYSRIRYVGNADFERTERQRKVLTNAFSKISDMNLIELNNLFNVVLPNITTDLTKGECISLLLDMADYKNYEIKSNRVPYDGTWSGIYVSGMAVLSIDFDTNIRNLQRDIYGIE